MQAFKRTIHHYNSTVKNEAEYMRTALAIRGEVLELEDRTKTLWTESPGVGAQYAYVLAAQRALQTAKQALQQAVTLMEEKGFVTASEAEPKTRKPKSKPVA